MSWLKNEVEVLISLGRMKRERVNKELTSPLEALGYEYLEMATVGAVLFDYQFAGFPGENRRSPTDAFLPNRWFTYGTVNGVVVHGSKINTMLFALFGRATGFSERELSLGANVNEIVGGWKDIVMGNPHGHVWRRESPSAQHATMLGSEIYDMHDNLESPAVVPAVLTREAVLGLQDPDGLWGDRVLWPSPYNVDEAAISRPQLSVRKDLLNGDD